MGSRWVSHAKHVRKVSWDLYPFSWNLEWQKRYDMSRNCQESNGDYFQRIQLFMLFLIG
jgi:hypothetical protein